jgi:hypothetical protein
MSLNNQQWNDLLQAIKDQRCTPMIGPEAYEKWLPKSRELAKKWIQQFGYPLAFQDFDVFYEKVKSTYNYPLADSHQLAQVAQYIAINDDFQNELLPKNILSQEIKKIKRPDFALEENRNTTYAVLADLKLPIYITTNYDYFMEEALESRGREPVTEICLWNEPLYHYIKEAGICSVFDKGSKDDEENEQENTIYPRYSPNKKPYKPTVTEPLVYHLHGIVEEPRSMVLTERDYIDFAINLNKNDEKMTLPPTIRTALAKTSLLFVGYRLEDITFRVIFQGVIRMLGDIQRPFRIAVQVPPRFEEKAIAYLNQYTRDVFESNICLTNLEDFISSLRDKWDKYPKN